MSIVIVFGFLFLVVFIPSLNQASAVCCFPYNMNYYADPITGDLVLNGELQNDSYRREPFGNTEYRFVFLDKDNNTILERSILLTDILPIKGGAVIPFLATFPFQSVLEDVDEKTMQQINSFRMDGTETLDYFSWKPADLVVSSNEPVSIGTVSGKNGDVFNKWQISGNVTNTYSQKTQNVYIAASLRNENDAVVGVAGYSGDSVQPIALDGYETKSFVISALVPVSEAPSSVNMYAESDESSMTYQYYKPVIIRDAVYNEDRMSSDPKKPVLISANITNISRNDLDFEWIIQIKKSPKSVSEGDISEYPESKVAFIKTIPYHINAQESIIVEYPWSPQANGIYFYDMYVWDDSRARALSFPFMDSFVDDNWVIVNVSSVTDQIKSGVSLDDVQCRKGLEIVHKASNGNLACVKPETRTKLIERGWVKSESILSSTESKYDPYNTRCSFGVIPHISESWKSFGMHPSDKDWETLGKHIVRQKFYQELKNRDIIFEPACFGVPTGPIEESYPPRFAMCSTVMASNGTQLYLEGTVNEFDIKYFNIDNKIPYQCDEHHFGCLCQFK
jgi:hypothetical protein